MGVGYHVAFMIPICLALVGDKMSSLVLSYLKRVSQWIGHWTSQLTRTYTGDSWGRGTNAKYSEPRLADLVVKESAFLRRYIVDEDFVLDAGCGEGRNAFRLVDELAIQPSQIVMLDINPWNLERVEQSIQADETTASLFELALGSIFAVPYPDDTFDAVLCLGDVLSLASAGSIEDGLKELRRVTKPGGILLFSLVTKEYLLRVAQEHNLPDKAREIEATGVYTDWNQQYGEGVFKSWGENSQVEEKIGAVGLELLEMQQVYIDYQDITARLLLACRKV